MESENPWKTLSIRTIHETPWIRMEEHEVISPSGGASQYGKVHFKNRAVGVVALDQDLQITLVGQYRYTLDEYSWEIPLGGAPFTENLLEAMQRELREETGLSASEWEYLGKVHTSHSSTDEEGHLYFAQGLTQGETEFDDTEVLQIKKIPFEEAIAMAMDGRISSVMSITAILKVARLLHL